MKKKIRRIMLIQPPAYTLKDKSDMNPNVPLGLCYIAGVLEKSGYEVSIVDAFVEGLDNEIPISDDRVLVGLSPKQIEERIRDYKPDLVGISSLFTLQRKNAHRICEIAKKVSSEIIVVMGGAHPTAEPEMVLEDNNVDYVVLGEGEIVILQLLDRLNNSQDIIDIDGACFKLNGKFIINSKHKFIEDLDSVPFPARHLLPMEKYFRFKKSHGTNRKSPYASIITSRGCTFNCTFCSTHTVWGRRYRFRSVDSIIKEIRFLIKKYGIKELLFEDDNLTLNRQRALDIFKGMITEKFDLIWRAPNGVAVGTLDEELLSMMRKSGCYQLGFAIESGSQTVLNNIIKKSLKLNEVPKLVKFARKIGIEVTLFLVVGMPGEKLEDMKETFRFARRLGIYDQQHISIATPYPGSELYNICQKKGYFVKGFNYDCLSIRNANIETEDWNSKEILELIKTERRKNHLCCMFKDPILFLKALIPEYIKIPVKKFLRPIKSTDVYYRS